MIMSLFFAILLMSALIASFNGVTLFALGADPIPVKDETELRDAIRTGDTTIVIDLKNDIELSSTLTIETGKTVTLMSNGVDGGFCKLIGAPNSDTITIVRSGNLVLDGIIVTHNSGDMGRGVYVSSGATLILNSGEITENNIYTGGSINDAQFGGGVYNWGTFIMNGGTISKNSAYNGGGVHSVVTFEMNGGTISENTAAGAGGGVDNLGTFEMTDGFFYKNIAVDGGGVFNREVFTLVDGQFLENEAIGGSGGGVYNDGPDCVFTLMDGAFSKNKAVVGGGVYNLGVIEMFGGVIGGATLAAGNIAIEYGGGVCNDGYFSVFNMYDGVISNNTALSGGGVEGDAGVFNMFGGKISDNTALWGGGFFIWGDSTFNMEGGVIFGNVADYYGGGVYNNWGVFTMSKVAVISNNTSPYDGGGVYNEWYFVMSDEAVVANNTAQGNGGGVYNEWYFVMSDEAVVANNTAKNGGGVYNIVSDAVSNMDDRVISGINGREGHSEYREGELYNDGGGKFDVLGKASILGNRATTYGGGVYNDDGVFNIGDATFSSDLVISLSYNSASYGGGVFNAKSVAVINMFSVAVISGNSANEGGGVNNAGVFNMFGGNISDNSASVGGGGVRTAHEFNMFDGKIFGNFGPVGGGGVLNYHNFNMFGGEISDNKAKTYGGGVHNNGSSGVGPAIFVMSGDAIISNNFGVFGGGVYNAYGATFNMTEHAVISGNSATDGTDGRGGGVHNNDRSVFNMLDAALVLDNFAIFGGGVFNNGNCTVNMFDDAAILDNTAFLYGGGVYNWNPYSPFIPAVFTMSDRASVSGNTARYGGGVQNTNIGLFIMSGDTIISGNSANYGGGIYTTSTLPNAITINGGRISDNTAFYGGGVYTDSNFTMIAGVINGNTAGLGGGVYVSSNGNVTLLGGELSSNVAAGSGGGVWVTSSNVVADFKKLYVANGVVFSDNSASELYDRAEEHDEVYMAQIHSTVWSSTCTQGYNNFDISYIQEGYDVRLVSVDVEHIYSNSGSVSESKVLLAGDYDLSELYQPDYNGRTFSVSKIIVEKYVTITYNKGLDRVSLDFNWDDSLGTIDYVPFGSDYSIKQPANVNVRSTLADFAGWSTTPGGIPEYLPDDTIVASDNLVLYAVWLPKDLQIEVDSTGVTIMGFSGLDVGIVPADIILHNDDSSVVIYDGADLECPIYDFETGYIYKITIYYEYTYAITYVIDGGINDPNNPLSYKEGDTSPTFITDPTRPGYTFDGWLVENSTGIFGPMFNYVIDVGSTGDFTLTAMWSVNEVSYVVRYLLWETEFSIAEDKVVSGQVVGGVVSLVPDEFEGYSAVDPRPVTATLNAADNVFTFYYLRVNVDTTWYVVHYYLEDTVVQVALDKVVVDKIGAEVIVKAIDIAGYTVVEPAFLGGVLNVTDNVFTFYYAVDVVVEAPAFTVTYDVNGGSGAPVDYNTYPVGVLVTVLPGEPTWVGHTFAGWVYNNEDYIGDDTFTMPAENVVLIAKWLQNTYVVTYVPGAQGTFASQSHAGLLYGVDTPAFSGGTPTGNSGYTFSGWSPSVASTVAGDVTYTAQWTYTGTSTDNNSGSGSGSSKPKPSPSPAAPTEDPPVEPSPPVVVPPEEPEFTWALLNLVLGVVGVVLAVVLVVLVLLWRNKDQKNEKNQNQQINPNDDEQKQKQRNTLLFLTAIAMSIVSIVVFFLTEDMSHKMAWIDNWTILHAILFIVEIIAITFTFKTKKDKTNTNNNNTNKN